MSGGNAQRLLDRIRQGDECAATELFDCYIERLLQLARTRLSPQLARRVDAEDVVQSVFRSFFNHAHDGNYHLRRGGDLWPLLAAITINHVRRKVAFHSADKRSMSSEESVCGLDSLRGVPPEALTKDPSPDQVSVLVEHLRVAMGQLTVRQRRIIELQLQGLATESIAARLRCSERTVLRAVQQLRQQLERNLHASAIV